MAKFKRNFKKQAGQVKGKVTKATKKYVKKVINADIEDKFFDAVNQAGVAINVISALQPLSTVTQGTTSNNRLGMKIRCKSLDVRLIFRPSATSTGVQNYRVVIFYDTRANNTTPTIAPVAQSTDLMESTVSYSSFNNYCRGRYKILYDRMLPSEFQGGAPPCIRVQTLHIKRKFNHPMEFTDSTVIPLKNAIWLYIFSDNAAAATDALYQYESRLIFEDA